MFSNKNNTTLLEILKSDTDDKIKEENGLLGNKIETPKVLTVEEIEKNIIDNKMNSSKLILQIDEILNYIENEVLE